MAVCVRGAVCVWLCVYVWLCMRVCVTLSRCDCVCDCVCVVPCPALLHCPLQAITTWRIKEENPEWTDWGIESELEFHLGKDVCFLPNPSKIWDTTGQSGRREQGGGSEVG